MMMNSLKSHWMFWQKIARLCALLTFGLLPVWYRFPFALVPESTLYVTRFAVFGCAVLTIGTWALSGFKGMGGLFNGWIRSLWAVTMAALVVWLYASSAWAFMRESHPELALNATLQAGVMVGFAWAVVSLRVSPVTVIGVLMFGMAWSALLAIGQVTAQGSVGGVFALLGEFPLGVDRGGVSYLQAGELRWLRPYGLLPHPNVLAGFLMVGVLASVYPLVTWRGWRWLMVLLIFCIGLWALLLTFSRGAWVGLAVGAVFGTLPLLWRYQRVNRRLWVAEERTPFQVKRVSGIKVNPGHVLRRLTTSLK